MRRDGQPDRLKRALADLPEVTAWLNRAIGGDEQAEAKFADLVYGHVEEMIRRVRRRFPGAAVRETTEADTQEVFFRLIRRQHADGSRPFNSRQEFLNACFTAGRNMLIDRLRVKHASPQSPVVEAQAGASSAGNAVLPVDSVIADEEQRLLKLALERLDEDEHTLVSLVYFAGMPQSHAFELLDLAEATGRRRLNRVKIKLAELMDSEGSGDGAGVSANGGG